jgi:hypothetical protein
MTRKIVHEIKLPKAVTIALYAIAIALVLNVAKPFISIGPALATLHYDTIRVQHSGGITVDNY